MPKTLSTHATRNPTRAVQQPRQRAKSSASKNTQALAAASRGAKSRALEDDIEEFYADFQEKVAALAIKHNRKQLYIKKRLSNGAQFKQRRAASIRNAIMHDLCKKAKEAGEDGSLPTIRDNLSKEEYLEIKENLTSAERARLMKQLTEHQAYKHRSIRATNKSLAMDAMQTANRIGDVLEDLFERTGVRAFAIFSRGSPEDPAAPHIVDSDDARQFFQRSFGKSFVDFVLKFEHWSCTQDTEVKESDDVQNVRKQIVMLILDGLRKIKNKKKIDMDYVNYKVDIRHKHGVELAGWPAGTPFVRPVKLSAEQARSIRDGLKSGTIRWVALTKTQRKELAEEIEGLLAEGPLKRRKQRSDKGKTRKGADSGSESESEEEDSGSGDEGEEDEDDRDEGEEEEEEEEEEVRPARKSATATKNTSRKSAPTTTPAAACKSAPTATAVTHMPTAPNANATSARAPVAPSSGAPDTLTPAPALAPCAANPTLAPPLPAVARTPFSPGTILDPETTAASANAGGTNPGAPHAWIRERGLAESNNGAEFPQLIGAGLGGFQQSYGMLPPPSANFGGVQQPYGMPPLPDSFVDHGAYNGEQSYGLPRLPDAGLQHVGGNGVQVESDDLRAAVSAAFAGADNDPVPANAALADATNVKASAQGKKRRSAGDKDDAPPPKKRAKSGKDAAGGDAPKRKTKRSAPDAESSTKARAIKKKRTTAA
ncbi:hypothetical protein B0H13DRAFT_2352340 [Mycena leptocephala]|nr:hypothetical protein B0H13DRAFT_2352340 [Mycena leptocephala]